MIAGHIPSGGKEHLQEIAGVCLFRSRAASCSHVTP